MKKITKLVMITAIMAVIGFLMAACGEEPKDDPPTKETYLTITGLDPSYTYYYTEDVGGHTITKQGTGYFYYNIELIDKSKDVLDLVNIYTMPREDEAQDKARDDAINNWVKNKYSVGSGIAEGSNLDFPNFYISRLYFGKWPGSDMEESICTSSDFKQSGSYKVLLKWTDSSGGISSVDYYYASKSPVDIKYGETAELTFPADFTLLKTVN